MYERVEVKLSTNLHTFVVEENAPLLPSSSSVLRFRPGDDDALSRCGASFVRPKPTRNFVVAVESRLSGENQADGFP